MADSNHGDFVTALKKLRAMEPTTVPHVIGERESHEGILFNREDPSVPSVVVSRFYDAPRSLAQKAVNASRSAQREWDQVPLEKRVEHVRRGIDYLTGQLDELTVRIAAETGKTRAASRSEVLEVIEFLKQFPTYVSAPEAFVESYPRPRPEIASQTILRPYGVFAVITPFNYPFALAAGPTIGALLAGNGVVIKTADRGPWSGYAVYQMARAMALPEGLVNILHGKTEVAKALVESDVDGIAFTGSGDVGSAIIRQASSGAWAKPVIAEMGGKNPVIVTDDADLEGAVSGIIFSAYDLSGQKCSALSRVLVTPGAHDRLVSLLAERIKGLRLDDPANPDAFGGPLVSESSVERYHSLVVTARDQGFRVNAGDPITADGYFAPPAIVSGVPEGHSMARDEHFVPLLTVSKVSSFEEGLQAANAVPYGLAAGLYTGDREEAKTFLHQMEAGCINVNIAGHATTGWWPGLSTFGGWKRSGSTGKQGYGKSYVQQFARQQSRKVPDGLADLLVS
jgi:1-pyrroline-5-carboxylate dehydrogenase